LRRENGEVLGQLGVPFSLILIGAQITDQRVLGGIGTKLLKMGFGPANPCPPHLGDWLGQN
jgi:hypothetical protein